jgi:hypothetical protein
LSDFARPNINILGSTSMWPNMRSILNLFKYGTQNNVYIIIYIYILSLKPLWRNNSQIQCFNALKVRPQARLRRYSMVSFGIFSQTFSICCTQISHVPVCAMSMFHSRNSSFQLGGLITSSMYLSISPIRPLNRWMFRWMLRCQGNSTDFGNATGFERQWFGPGPQSFRVEWFVPVVSRRVSRVQPPRSEFWGQQRQPWGALSETLPETSWNFPDFRRLGLDRRKTSEEESTSGIANVATMQLLLQSVRTVAQCAAQDLWFGSAKGISNCSQLFPRFPSADTTDAWSTVLDRHTPAPEGPTMGDQLWSKSLPGPPSTPRTAISLGDQTIHYGIARGHDLRHLQVAQARRIPQDPAGSRRVPQGRWPWSILKRNTPRKTRKTLSFDVVCIL